MITKAAAVFLAHGTHAWGPKQVEPKKLPSFLTEAQPIERVSLGQGHVEVTANGPTKLDLHAEPPRLLWLAKNPPIRKA